MNWKQAVYLLIILVILQILLAILCFECFVVFWMMAGSFIGLFFIFLIGGFIYWYLGDECW